MIGMGWVYQVYPTIYLVPKLAMFSAPLLLAHQKSDDSDENASKITNITKRRKKKQWDQTQLIAQIGKNLVTVLHLNAHIRWQIILYFFILIHPKSHPTCFLGYTSYVGE